MIFPLAPKETQRSTAYARPCITAGLILACANLGGVARAQTTKTFIDYLKPTPITCAPLSSETWGVEGVLPRDLCNGIESARGAGVPPEYYYWDGQILKAQDGKYHMFMSTWSGADGFNPGWLGSDAYHAISEQGVLGPYLRQDYVYNNNGSHKGHNVSALELADGRYAVVVSETVPFTIYTSSSLDGPWTGCTASIQANGINYTDGNFASNVSLVVRHDGKHQIVQRHGHIGLADNLCGPYLLQKPTWAFSPENLPTIDSIYPRRTEIPGVPSPSYAWEEDPHIWRSGGMYHVLYSGSGDRVGWHLYSPDGINDWRDGGLSCNPRLYEQMFCYEGSTTCTQWYKMERPGVVLEDGHVTHVTWAVADVDKDNQIPGNSNHGSKIIVIPFDGVAFDNDYGVGGGGGAGGAAGTGGTETGGSEHGGAATGGMEATGGLPGTGGSPETGGMEATGGTFGTGGVEATGGLPGTGVLPPSGGVPATGGLATGGSTATGGTAPATGSTMSTGGTTATGGAGSPTGGTIGGGTTTGGATPGAGGAGATGGGAVGGADSLGRDGSSDEGGCDCRVAGQRSSSTLWALLGMVGLLGVRADRRRGSRPPPPSP
ncbi:MAG: hypothetical protein JW751_01920 [Polyangiaceae bacterium]|nr:hypothetical protein [Polyangiaceae bacterium]